MLGAINAKFFSEFEIPPLSILQQQKIAELYLLAKRRRRCFASCRQRRSATTIC